MKTLLLLSALLATQAFAAVTAVKGRKVGNSTYFVCNLERENIDKKVFKKQSHFPFPLEKGEHYELKGSLRWNNYQLIFSADGKVSITISEVVKGETLTALKELDLGKDAQYESFKIQVDLKNKSIVIPYHIQCGPE